MRSRPGPEGDSCLLFLGERRKRVSAYLVYEIHGKTNSSGKVSILIKAVATPTPEAALWLIREKYPSVKEESVYVTIPAAHKYPLRKGPIHVRTTMEGTPIRRTR